MKKLILKRINEHLFEAALMAGYYDTDLARRINDLAAEVVNIASVSQEGKTSQMIDQEERQIFENTLKELIND